MWPLIDSTSPGQSGPERNGKREWLHITPELQNGSFTTRYNSMSYPQYSKYNYTKDQVVINSNH